MTLLDCPICRQDCTKACNHCSSQRWVAEALEALRCKLAELEIMEWEEIFREAA